MKWSHFADHITKKTITLLSYLRHCKTLHTLHTCHSTFSICCTASTTCHHIPDSHYLCRLTMSNAKKMIEAKIGGKKVMVFSKSYCPFCSKAKKVLQEYINSGELSPNDYEVMEIEDNPDMDAIQMELRGITGASSVCIGLMKSHRQMPCINYFALCLKLYHTHTVCYYWMNYELLIIIYLYCVRVWINKTTNT